jgi:hypothetical protein
MITMRAALEADVLALALDRGRLPGTAGHAAAREHLARRMRELGLAPWSGAGFDLPYRAGAFEGHNLVGVLPGSERSEWGSPGDSGGPSLAPVLVGAHYDSAIAAPCADDNCAAAAIALAVTAAVPRARRRDLVLAFFDAEENPYTHTDLMGSVRFYREQRGDRPIHCALIQDLTGHDVSLGRSARPEAAAAAAALRDLLFVTGAESHPALAPLLRGCVGPGGLPVIATLNRNVGDVSDHGVFRRDGVPYLFFSCGHWEHYHRPTDTPDRLNYAKMERIALLIGAVAAQLDGQDLAGTRGLETVADTTAIESEMLAAALGPLHGRVLAMTGLTQARTRAELDQFAARLQAAGI